MQNLSSSTPAPQDLHTSRQPARIETLIANAARIASDEANDHLSWGDRDAIARQLHEALQLLRAATTTPKPTPAPESETVITCSECGDEVELDQAIRGECLTCACYYAQANSN